MKNRNMVKASLATGMSLAVLLTSTALPAQAVESNVPTFTANAVAPQTDPFATEKAELLTRINAYRASLGLQALVMNDSLGTVAQNWTSTTASAGTFKHNPNFSTQIPQPWSYTAEIIAADSDPEAMVAGWIYSPSHNAIISEPKAKEIGFGYAPMTNPNGEYPGTFYATAVLANFGDLPPRLTAYPHAPVFTATEYTIPWVVGLNYLVNGTVKAPGTYKGSGTVSIKAVPDATDVALWPGVESSWSHTYEIAYPPMPSPVPPPTGPVPPQQPAPGPAPSPTPTPTPVPVTPKYAIKSVSEMVAIDVSGKLWNYHDMKTPRTLIGSGWGAFSDIHLTDWNNDKIIDIVAKTTAGGLYVYQGNTAGGFAANKVLGKSGWQNYEIDVVKWKKTDKFTGVIAKDKLTGNVFYYPNPSGNTLGTRYQIGAGWKTMNLNLLDWDKDGNVDIVARTATGEMRLYRTNGAGTFINETRKLVGSGWKGFTHVGTVRKFRGSTADGVLARNAAGTLYYYNTVKNNWVSPVSLGGGWSTYKIANS